MKEFVVCYTLENDIKRERIIKEPNVKKEEVFQEILEKINKRKYFLAKGNKGEFWINSSLIRFIRVIEKKHPIYHLGHF
jgi:hypothetical protein